MTRAPYRPGVGAVVAALLLPPLGVWLARGLGLAFWLSLVLTCLAFVPGVIFALVAVLAPDALAGRDVNRA
jgi:uncharacterized membrane protein YqaE (UPF0057 family)